MSTTSYRTHTCGELRLSHVGETVTLAGWVQTARDKNFAAFIDLRDRHGITQLIAHNPNHGSTTTANTDTSSTQPCLYDLAKSLGRETVIQITGTVVERGKDANEDRATGAIEVVMDDLKILSKAKVPPLKIENETDASEDTSLKWRFLDLRRPILQERLIIRNKILHSIRMELGSANFLEIETPILIKSTPEGARDFIVPTRKFNHFYALPQSPQTFKQLLMVAGMDRYFQIARCFRDEDLRADRQPEFTQIDCEMSFVSRNDVLHIFEEMIRRVFKETKGIDLPNPFPRLNYRVAMEKYGIDKPDLRYEMCLTDLTDLSTPASGDTFPPFSNAGLVVGLCIPKGCEKWKSTKSLKALEKRAKTEAGAPFMVWVKCECLQEGNLYLDSSAKKYFSTQELAAWANKMNANEGDLLCIFAGPGGRNADATREIAGKWRHLMGSELGFRPLETFCPLWVVDFPLLEWSEEQEKWSAKHHPFTRCLLEDEEKIAIMAEQFKNSKGNEPVSFSDFLEKNGIDCGEFRSDAYDLVINGVEVGGGSIRISEKETQENMFTLLGLTDAQAKEQFGFLLSAFEYGSPPHGGLAFGLDRLCAIICGVNSIRDVMAFPKNSAGRDVMIDAPSEIAKEQLEELKLEIRTTQLKEAAEQIVN